MNKSEPLLEFEEEVGSPRCLITLSVRIPAGDRWHIQLKITQCMGKLLQNKSQDSCEYLNNDWLFDDVKELLLIF